MFWRTNRNHSIGEHEARGRTQPSGSRKPLLRKPALHLSRSSASAGDFSFEVGTTKALREALSGRKSEVVQDMLDVACVHIASLGDLLCAAASIRLPQPSRACKFATRSNQWPAPNRLGSSRAAPAETSRAPTSEANSSQEYVRSDNEERIKPARPRSEEPREPPQPLPLP